MAQDQMVDQLILEARRAMALRHMGRCQIEDRLTLVLVDHHLRVFLLNNECLIESLLILDSPQVKDHLLKATLKATPRVILTALSKVLPKDLQAMGSAPTRLDLTDLRLLLISQAAQDRK